MKCLRRLAPKNFLCMYRLRNGAVAIAAIMSIVSLICVIVLLLNLFHYRKSDDCSETLVRSIYSYCMNAIIYCVGMFFINIWLVWGVLTQKASVVLSWVVITTMWWLQSSSFVFTLLAVKIMDIGLDWIAALVAAIIAFAIIAYFILVVYGYWLQLKSRVRVHSTTMSATG